MKKHQEKKEKIKQDSDISGLLMYTITIKIMVAPLTSIFILSVNNAQSSLPNFSHV